MSTRKTSPLNQRIISQRSDLPFNSSTSQHELQDGVVYRFDGFVTSSDPIVLADNSPIIGGHGGIDGFIYTGGSTAIIGNSANLFLRNAFFSAPSGTIFDISGDLTDEVLVESASFAQAPGFGRIASLGNINGMRVPTFKFCDFGEFDGGLTFGTTSGGVSPDKILIDGCPVRGVTASGVTAFTFDTQTIISEYKNNFNKNFQSDTEVVRVTSGNSPSETFLSESNTHDSSVTQSNILNGEASVEAVGYKVVDSPPLTSSSIVGEVSLDANTTTTINNQNTFVPIAGSTTLAPTAERVIATGSNGQLEYQGTIGDVKAEARFFASVASSGNKETYAIGIEQNGSLIAASELAFEGSNKPQTTSTSAIFQIKDADTVQPVVANLDGTSDITFGSYRFDLLSISTI